MSPHAERVTYTRTKEADRESDPPLSDRQLQVLQLAACGFSFWQIGDAIGIRGQTVRHHLQHAREALRARNTTHAVALALSKNLIKLEECQ